MKNIHILPTDKPSKLYSFYGILEDLSCDKTFTIVNEEIAKINLHKDLKEYQEKLIKANWKSENIYITSDEEIKKGDWFIHYSHETTTLLKAIEINSRIVDNQGTVCDIDYCKKVILTTDRDLIKDGVQAIDDEFLEWWIKNPSCEYIKTEKWLDDEGGVLYSRIIPKEEPKQDLRKIVEEVFNEQPRELFLMNANSVIDTRIPKEPKQELERGITITHVGKQETLEEASERVVENLKDFDSKRFTKAGFKLGAKWQQEQYEILLDEYHEYTVDCIEIELKRPLAFKKWLKQFKK